MIKCRRRFQLALVCFCIFCRLHSQTLNNEDDILYWSQHHRLTFDNFKWKPTQSDTTLSEASPAMLTHKLGAIIKSIDVHILTKHSKTTFTIQAGMKPNLSWIKDYGDTAELKHEQGHFDICEIYARILRRDIKKATSLSEAKEIYEKTIADEEAEQNKYDSHNTYQAGGIAPDWKEKVSTRLKELDAYKNPVVTLPIDK